MGINLAGPLNIDQLQNIINQGFMDWRKLLGAEKVTNGTFTGAATGWTLNTGWTYNANAVDRDGAGTATMEQDVSAVVGEIYRVEYTISAYTDGSVTVTLGGTAGTSRSSAATFVEYIKAATTGNLIFTPVAAATFTIDTVSVKKVGYVATDGVAAWVEDRGATAGKGALHLMTEDGTKHVFGDRVGIGTHDPTSELELIGDFTFGTTGKGLITALSDTATLLGIARNAAGQKQTVWTINTAATVANSYLTAQVGGTWTLASGETWEIPAVTIGGTLALGVNMLTTTSGALKSLGSADTIMVRNVADSAYGTLRLLNIENYGDIKYQATGKVLAAYGADDATLICQAKDNGVALVTIARFVAAADAYFEATLGIVLAPVAQMAVPVEGRLIYNSATDKLNFWNGSAWEVVTSA